jgi:hypothetical protein
VRKGRLDEAKEAGQLRADADTAALARYFWNGWEGVVVRCRARCKVRLRRTTTALGGAWFAAKPNTAAPQSRLSLAAVRGLPATHERDLIVLGLDDAACQAL